MELQNAPAGRRDTKGIVLTIVPTNISSYRFEHEEDPAIPMDPRHDFVLAKQTKQSQRILMLHVMTGSSVASSDSSE
uniref:Uncharacterized protein n=1 Tax=Oryza brachyantha TaxID=4533 RepID=J3L2G6_ORYBR